MSPANHYTADDFRQHLAWWKPENFDANVPIVGKPAELAESEGAALAQLALAWLPAKKDCIVPIPGLRNPDRAAQNVAAADLMPTGRGASGAEGGVSYAQPMREPHPVELSGTFVTRRDDRWRGDRWYGRFRLRFPQVSPWPDLYTTFVRVRPGWRSLVEETLSVVATEVPRQKTWPVHLLNQKVHGRGWEFDLGPPEADYLCL